MAELLIADHLTKNSMSDAAVSADYDRQFVALKDAKEYKIRDIVLIDDAAAEAALANVSKCDAFDKAAKKKSSDPSKAAGGEFVKRCSVCCADSSSECLAYH